jgi:hypothetical protein
VLGRWEVDRGPQELAYDFWWHLGHDTMITRYCQELCIGGWAHPLK